MKIRKSLLLAATLLLCSSFLFAQNQEQRQIKEEGKVEFAPHWFMQIQGGAAHTIGEAGFGDLISPAAALNFGYRFNPLFGLRFGAGGWQAKGGWVNPEQVYKYKFIQGNVDAVLNLSNLFCKFNPERVLDVYAFLGAGFNHAFDNDEAGALQTHGSYQLAYLWKDSKNFIVGRGGLGLNIRLSDYVGLNVEANANCLSDKFNSKKAGNADWHFNGLVGLTIKFGKGYKKTEPVYYEPVPAPAPIVKEEPKPVVVKEEPKVEEVKPLTENIFFNINSSAIRSSEEGKINALVSYLNNHPNAKVTITGYADRATGTAGVNARLSKERSAEVAEALKAKGIVSGRIITDAKGDTVQPFSAVEENRVSICIAE